jgi:Ca2+-binding EF-hand superfamily protein
MRRSSPKPRLDSNTASKKHLSSITNISNTNSRLNLSGTIELDITQKFTQQEIKQSRLEYKKFCNKVEIMTKKGFLEYFRLEDLEGTLLADRLYASFSPTGSIDFTKFMRGIATWSTGSLEERTQILFTMFDIKRNNLIEKSDIKRLLLSILNYMIDLELSGYNAQVLQDDIKNMSLQEREEAIEIILQPYGPVITYEEFSAYIHSNNILKQVLET